MNTKAQEIIEEFFESNISRNDEKVISFFQSNSVILNNLDDFDDFHEYESYLIIKATYTKSLFILGSFTKAINSSEQQIEIIKKHQEKFGLDLDDRSTLYHQALFYKACSLYRLKEYKKAIEIFEHLLEKEPDDEGYQEWYKAALKKKKTVFYFIISISPTVLILSLFIFDFPPKVRLFISILAMGLILVWGIYDLIRYYKRKNIINKRA